MKNDILFELKNASEYEYINLLPKTRKNLVEVSRLAEQIFVNNFIFELREVKK